MDTGCEAQRSTTLKGVPVPAGWAEADVRLSVSFLPPVPSGSPHSSRSQGRPQMPRPASEPHEGAPPAAGVWGENEQMLSPRLRGKKILLIFQSNVAVGCLGPRVTEDRPCDCVSTRADLFGPRRKGVLQPSWGSCLRALAKASPWARTRLPGSSPGRTLHADGRTRAAAPPAGPLRGGIRPSRPRGRGQPQGREWGSQGVTGQTCSPVTGVLADKEPSGHRRKPSAVSVILCRGRAC